MYVWIFKFITAIITLFTSFAYVFHKRIKGIKTKRNIKYLKKGNIYNKLDVHFEKCENETLKPCIIYFHGGGWTSFSKCVYTTLCRRLAKLGYVVFNVNYSLAPVHKMDKIISDCASAVDFAQGIAKDFNGDKNKIILAGDSAGAHLSALIAGLSTCNNSQIPEIKDKIKALLLFYGVYDINTMVESKFLNIKTYGKAVLNGKLKDKVENSEYSPINYVTSNFPPCFLVSGAIDKLHKTQSLEFYKKLTEQGVKVKKLFFDENEKSAGHAFMVFDWRKAYKETIKHIEKFLKEEIK